jgi:hypothetical protein
LRLRQSFLSAGHREKTMGGLLVNGRFRSNQAEVVSNFVRLTQRAGRGSTARKRPFPEDPGGDNPRDILFSEQYKSVVLEQQSDSKTSCHVPKQQTRCYP